MYFFQKEFSPVKYLRSLEMALVYETLLLYREEESLKLLRNCWTNYYELIIWLNIFSYVEFGNRSYKQTSILPVSEL